MNATTQVGVQILRGADPMKTKALMLASQMFLAAMWVPTGGQAAVDMFLVLGDIKGESTDKKYPDSIDVLAWSWGMANLGATVLGGGAGAGKISVQDLSLTKYVDKSSPTLMLFCANGRYIPQATLIVRKAGDTPRDYLVITLTQVMVTSVSTGGAGGEDRLIESVSLNFAQFKVEYTPQNKDGTPGTPISMAWNIAGNAEP
jgi:type VI secretion system secreted protein Hcp